MIKLEKYARWEFHKALRQARREETGSKRCIALAWVARYGPKKYLAGTVDAAVAAAGEEEDCYRAISPLAWPLRALLERGETDSASALLGSALKKSKSVIPQSSQSAALVLVFQASMYGTVSLWPKAFHALVEASLPIEHWRQRQSICDAILMVARHDMNLAREVVERLQDDRLQKKMILKLEAGETLAPRRFFW